MNRYVRLNSLAIMMTSHFDITGTVIVYSVRVAQSQVRAV